MTGSESFKYKTIISGGTSGVDDKRSVSITIPLKYFSNFWRALHIPIINYEVNIILTWSKNYVLTDIKTHVANAQGDPSAINAPMRIIFYK